VLIEEVQRPSAHTRVSGERGTLLNGPDDDRLRKEEKKKQIGKTTVARWQASDPQAITLMLAG
jgi:hypothetical protein